MTSKPFALPAIVLASCLTALPARAQLTPVGVWHTIDDRTNEPKGEVIITEVNGVIIGRVGRALKPDPKAKRICDDCKDDRKDQTIVGMEIIRGVKNKVPMPCGQAAARYSTPTKARNTPFGSPP